MKRKEFPDLTRVLDAILGDWRAIKGFPHIDPSLPTIADPSLTQMVELPSRGRPKGRDSAEMVDEVAALVAAGVMRTRAAKIVLLRYGCKGDLKNRADHLVRALRKRQRHNSAIKSPRYQNRLSHAGFLNVLSDIIRPI
jgi:hypothetical protein